MMATRFSDAQVASYIQNNALSGAGLQQAAQVFQLPADQIARAQNLLAQGDPSIAAASQAYEAAVAGRPDLVAENLAFYNAATGTGSGLANVQAPVVQPPVVRPPPVVRQPPVVQPPVVQPPTLPTGYDQAYINRLIGEAAKQAGGTLSYADAANALRNLGVPLSMLNAAMGTGLITEGVNPFANATQGMQGNTRGNYTSIPIGVSSFNQNFQNYMNTPLGAQYNPGVTGGVSPYGAVMNQMQDFRNPYAGVMANQPIGGYNPNIYNPNLLSDFMKQRAAELSAAGLPVPFGFDGGGDGPGGTGDGAGSGAGDGGPGGAADGGSGPGDGPGTGAGWYMGGLIDRVSGANPSGPDDGQINAQIGEYVVKKSSVDKYGKGLLDMINEGKIPAKKIKSLLD
jgi:hypothetical protein